MAEHIDWQKTTAISRIAQRLKDDPGIPMPRLYSEVAGYVGASVVDVERWWKGRSQP